MPVKQMLDGPFGPKERKKMRIIYVVLMMFCIEFIVYPQDINDLIFNGGYVETNIHLKNGEIDIMPFLKGLPEEIISTYIFEEYNGIILLTIDDQKNTKFALIFNHEFGIATFYNPIIAESIIMQQFVNNENIYPRNSKFDAYIDSINDYNITASSSLKEENCDYSPENLRKSIIDGPWVEGVKGDGIGEYLEIEFKEKSNINALLISNGFVSYQKPDLFVKNNRVKKILIESADGKMSIEYDLLDTAALQTIRLNQNITNIKITILEVYNGNVWDDTCINMIVGLHL